MRRVALVGQPYDSGLRGFRMGTGVDVLFESGLVDQLAARGIDVAVTQVSRTPEPGYEIRNTIVLDADVAPRLNPRAAAPTPSTSTSISTTSIQAPARPTSTRHPAGSHAPSSATRSQRSPAWESPSPPPHSPPTSPHAIPSAASPEPPSRSPPKSLNASHSSAVVQLLSVASRKPKATSTAPVTVST